jgi:DNA invertase Pin-like site-specific DNA recombinase
MLGQQPDVCDTPGMKIGVARVSTLDQNVEAQEAVLKEAGCDTVFSDTMSGRTRDRPGLKAALAMAREGDQIVVTKLDRLGRSVADLVAIFGELEARGITVRVLNLGIDTSTSIGRLVRTIMAGVAEFEADLIRERTLEGLADARKHGRHGGRRPVMSMNKARAALRFYEESDATWTQVAAEWGVSRRTLMTWVDKVRVEEAA